MPSPRSPSSLEPRWIEVLEDVGRSVLGAADRDGQALAAEVTRLSRVYTGREGGLEEAERLRAARLRFYLPRDLPKIEGPLEELRRANALPPGPRWRVLDVGAGYGTTSLGVARFARRLGQGGVHVEGVDVVAIERDRRALDAFRAVARAAAEAELIAPLTLDERDLDARALAPKSLGRFDLVVLGLSLGEMCDSDEAAEALLRRLGACLEPDGALIVVEPALRTSARALSRVRDRLMAAPGGLSIVGPCFTDHPCPMLRRPRDWCHAQLSVALPPALARVAEAAGLRRSRLTYAYLTLRPAGPARRDRYRVVGGPVSSKGKTEWDACGPAGLVKLRRLKRDVKRAPSPLDGLERGATITVEAPLEDGAGLRVTGEVDCPD